MASFGEELKRERELRDISLKEISEATKISIRFLEALEHNNFEILPGGIFNRGFIRSYSRFIGVDGEEMVNAYLHEISMREARLEQAGGASLPSPAQTGEVFRPETRRTGRLEPRPGLQPATSPEPRVSSIAYENPDNARGRASVALWVLVVLVLVAAASLLTMSLTGEPAGGDGSGSHDQAVKARLAKKAPAPAAASVSPGPVTLPQESPADEPASAGPGRQADPETASAEPAASSSQVEAPPPPLEHQLWVKASESTLLVVECSGKISLDQELWPGQSKRLDCAEPIVLSAANAGAVEYALDDGPPTLLGEVGQEIEGVTVAPPPAPAKPDKPLQKSPGPRKDAGAGN